MKAAYFEQTGEPEVIQVGERPDPEPGPTEALVQVRAGCVNPIDTYIRGGMVPMPVPMPYIVGCDLAGEVVSVGPEVKGLKPGDRVWATNQGLMGRQGVSSERAAVDEMWLYPLPEGVDAKDAAALALVGMTACLGLFAHAGLESGETVFVNGGSGGVGSAVVQMAKAAGARVIATAGSAEKARLCGELGADDVILYKEQDVAETVRATVPDGVNVWFETLREPDLELSVPLLSKFGRLVLMAGRDARPTLPIGPFYTRDCRMLGFAMFNAAPEVQRRCAERINGWLREGRLKALIGKVFPLEQVAEAHRLQEDNTLRGAGTLTGKIVIEI